MNRKQSLILGADRFLVVEDLLELVNSGVINYTVSDHHIARARV
jgi:hypothetical protein